jgi:hypothetical protein
MSLAGDWAAAAGTNGEPEGGDKEAEARAARMKTGLTKGERIFK